MYEAVEKLSDIPADRLLSTAERKALFEELKDAQTRLACAESLLEIAVESCKDELKKRVAAAVGAHEKGFEVVRICRVMKLPRSTFYASPKTMLKQSKDVDLVEKITAIQNDFFFTIGRCRMRTLLQRRFGISVCETTLQRVMSRHSLSARIRQVRKAKPHAGRACKQDLLGNLLNRKFQADKSLHRMVTDVTYVPYFENGQWYWGYLSLEQDLYDRSIVAWVYSKKLS